MGLWKAMSIYIIRTSEVPVALIEVGFMTNQEELNLLNSTDYQKKAAEGVYHAISRAFWMTLVRKPMSYREMEKWNEQNYFCNRKRRKNARDQRHYRQIWMWRLLSMKEAGIQTGYCRRWKDI